MDVSETTGGVFGVLHMAVDDADSMRGQGCRAVVVGNGAADAAYVRAAWVRAEALDRGVIW
jgi:hypothetical protein